MSMVSLARVARTAHQGRLEASVWLDGMPRHNSGFLDPPKSLVDEFAWFPSVANRAVGHAIEVDPTSGVQATSLHSSFG
jgi:hypothetical protein